MALWWPIAAVARLGTSAAAAIPDVDFARFGVQCRSMSKLWREIKGGWREWAV